MKVSFKQSGGFAGLSQGCALDTEGMPVEEMELLQRLVSESGILEAHSTGDQGQGRPPVYDCLSYEITVESPQGTRKILLTDPEITEKMVPLLSHLVDRAQPQPPH